MTALAAEAAVQDKNCLSEIFALSHADLNLISFRLSPLTDREDGMRLSYRFSRYFPDVIVVWKDGLFYALAKQGQALPANAEWAEALEYIHREICEPSDPKWRFQRSRNPQVTPDIIAAFAEQILDVCQPFRPKTVYSEQNIEVKRRADFGAETVEINQTLNPAIALSSHSRIMFRGTLNDFLATHPYRQNPERLLVGLKVETLDTDSTATIEEIAGTIAEHRTSLLTKASGAISRTALEEAPADQPVVVVRFGQNSKRLYPYAMAALRPCVTAETANQLDIDFGTLLEHTKISYVDRQQLLKEYSAVAKEALQHYGIQFLKAINGRDNEDLFWLPERPIEQTPIQFGQGVIGLYNGILSGLARGGVYQRHQDYQNASERPIRLAVLNLLKPEVRVNGFMQQVQQQLDRYKFPSLQLNASTEAISVNNWNSPESRAMLEDKLDELMTIKPDIMFVFLPQSDRSCDDNESGSLYHRIYSKLLRRQIASQFIYEETLRRETRFVLNQVMLGVLAKLGNIPFVLAEPLQVADVFIGLDVARSKKQRLAGSMNACAGVCLYGNRGEFIRAKSEDAAIEGEEIPQRFLETLLPAGTLRGKTVLIYRDGRFCGDEVTHLLNWAKAIQSQFILVECRKSGTSRLYNLSRSMLERGRSIAAPTRGLGLKLSSHEAILVTTQVSDRIGVPRPLRLTVRSEGYPASIEQIMDATLKLTLLHHGALKPPRLPMLLHGADRLADLRLNGVYMPECDRQFWL